MSPLLSILRAAHCRSTHHYFALDAIPMVQTDAGKRLTSLLLHHHWRYLTGAKDPDTRFRDFQNHVIHVKDGYWGGAPRVAHKWYDRMQRYLREERYSDAAHAAGVLSHYFTDPMQPLHTEQSAREAVLHRPIEWSITKSYDAIFRDWKQDEMRVVFQISDEPGWLGEAILHGARFANRKYATMLDSYDLARGAKDPPAGLNADLRAVIAELFGLCITGWARVLERAASDAEAQRGKPLPTASLSIPTLLASVCIPARLWLRRIENKAEQLAVSQLVDEFQSTGTLKQHLPVEVDIVHRVVDIYQDEKRWKQQRQERLASKETVIRIETVKEIAQESAMTAGDELPATLPFVPRDARRGSLAAADPLLDAPSIGSKTAARFTAIGVHTVGEFLSASAEDLAGLLLTYWITDATVSQWQSQARLMCEVPGLKSRDAQLLAGAGQASAVQLARCEPASLHAQVSQFAITSTGRRYLRGAAPPSLADVESWIRDAKGSLSASQSQRRSA